MPIESGLFPRGADRFFSEVGGQETTKTESEPEADPVCDKPGNVFVRLDGTVNRNRKGDSFASLAEDHPSRRDIFNQNRFTTAG
jgi:hypothetical protein